LTPTSQVLSKSSRLGSKHVLLSLHGQPELGPDPPTVAAEVQATLATLAAFASGLDPPIHLHLRHTSKNSAIAGQSVAAQCAWAKSMPFPLLLAPNTGLAAAEGVSVADLAACVGVGESVRGVDIRAASSGVKAPAPAPATPRVSPTAAMVLVDGVTPPQFRTEAAPLVGASGSGTDPVLLGKIAQYIRLFHVANATLVLDPSYAVTAEEEEDSLFLENVIADSGPPVPPPPPPPPPPGPLGCYTLGSPIPGFCSVIQGKPSHLSNHTRIVFGCAPPGPPPGKGKCYADYMLKIGKWARAYGNAPNPPVAGDEGRSATVIFEKDGQWTIQVTLIDGAASIGVGFGVTTNGALKSNPTAGGVEREHMPTAPTSPAAPAAPAAPTKAPWVWASDPAGYMAAGDVGSIVCSNGVHYSCAKAPHTPPV
jgi:hypothetical protein